MQFQVIITPSAKADIFEVNTWLLENYPNLSNNWIWGISQAVTSLSKFPERCPISPESEAFDVIVRQLLYGNKPNVYRILYSIQDEKVYILRVRSTNQKSILDE
jgi:plasmid stabilization system protein ParE